MKETIKKSVIGGITFFTTVGVCFVVYGTLVNLPPKVGTGSGLTSNSWNMMVDSLTELDGKINTINNLISTKSFGARQTKSPDVVYLADTDGFIIVNPSAGNGYYSVLSDNTSLPTILRTKGKSYATYGSQAGSMVPVKKGDYWKVVTTYSSAPDGVFWMPFGN